MERTTSFRSTDRCRSSFSYITSILKKATHQRRLLICCLGLAALLVVNPVPSVAQDEFGDTDYYGYETLSDPTTNPSMVNYNNPQDPWCGNGWCEDGERYGEGNFCCRDCGECCMDEECSSEDQCLTGRCGASGMCYFTNEKYTDCAEEGTECTDKACNPDSGECEWQGTPCHEQEGTVCTGPDGLECVSGSCQEVGPQKECSDNNVCTSDTCNTHTGADGQAPGCQFIPVSCEDDNDPCTAELCDPVVGCDSIPIPGCTGCMGDPSSCDDGNPCTINGCSANGDCVGIPVECDDGDPCTDDSCQQNIGCVFTESADPGCFPSPEPWPTPSWPQGDDDDDDDDGGKPCSTDQECNDWNDCTMDICKLGQCDNIEIPSCP